MRAFALRLGSVVLAGLFTETSTTYLLKCLRVSTNLSVRTYKRKLTKTQNHFTAN